mgnify:CR=1 FL=1
MSMMSEADLHFDLLEHYDPNTAVYLWASTGDTWGVAVATNEQPPRNFLLSVEFEGGSGEFRSVRPELRRIGESGIYPVRCLNVDEALLVYGFAAIGSANRLPQADASLFF